MSMTRPAQVPADAPAAEPATEILSRPAELRAWRSTAYRLIVAGFALVIAWNYFQQVVTLLLVLVLTVILALPLAALADGLQRRRIPRMVSVIVAMALLLAILLAFAIWVAPSALQEARAFVLQIPAYAAELRAAIRERLGIAPADFGTPIRDYVLRVFEAPQMLISAGTTIAQVLVGVLLIAVTAVYIAINPRPLVTGFLRLVEPRQRDRAATILERLRDRWLGWLKGTLVDMLLTGALTYLGLSLLGVEYALVFAVITGLLEFVPYIGPILAAIPPVLFALTQSPEQALLVLLMYVAIQQIEGHLIIPLVMAKAVSLHPAVVAFGVVLIGQIFGIIGVFVAVPILAAIVILLDELRVKPLERRASGERAPAGPVGTASRGS
jgi:predicted PurR-regulated permease PerM